MEWRDEGVILTVRRHGESAAILDVFTREHGRHAGVVRGGGSWRMAPTLQPGAQTDLEWRARLEEHLGAYRVEPRRSRAAALMGDGDALAAFGAVAALLTAYLADREPHPALYAATIDLLDALETNGGWGHAYVAWEIMLMNDLGFPLDLSSCAATGAIEDLVWVSPRTGRAVSREAGEPYAERLLALPDFLGGASGGGLEAGMALTDHFLKQWIAPAFGGHQPPDARRRLAERLARRS